MRELAPQALAFGLIVNPNNPNADRDAKTLAALGDADGRTMKIVKVPREQDLEAAFADLADARVGALTIGNDALLASWYQQIGSFATRYKRSQRFSVVLVVASHSLQVLLPLMDRELVIFIE
jgi:hypothetical protein